MAELNKQILQYLNSLLENDFFYTFSSFFSDFPIFFLPVFLILAWIYWTFAKNKNTSETSAKFQVSEQISKSRKVDLLFIFYSVVAAISTNLIFQKFFFFTRPEESGMCSEKGKLILDHIPNASFPSDHAAVSFAFLVALYLAGYKKIFFIFLPFVIFMNLSRIIVCVHYPFDILVGALVGIFWAFITFKYLKKLKIFEHLNNFILKIASFIKL